MAVPTTLTLLRSISMCIYCNTNNYRKIYEQHNGPIPKDTEGRSYEIHHIDGNHTNNHPSNLKCVTLREHYDIHYAQKDYGACFKMAKRMLLSVEEKAVLASAFNMQRVANGTHPFVGPNLNKKRVEAGTHHLLGGKIQSESNQRRLRNGTHHLLGGEIQRQGNLKRLAEGNHPSQVVCTCPICQRTIHGRGNLTQHLRKCSKNS